MSMFTCGGKFMTSFGTKGNDPGQFNQPHGLVMDKNGVKNIMFVIIATIVCRSFNIVIVNNTHHQ